MVGRWVARGSGNVEDRGSTEARPSTSTSTSTPKIDLDVAVEVAVGVAVGVAVVRVAPHLARTGATFGAGTGGAVQFGQ
jgi:hypothetical protein